MKINEKIKELRKKNNLTQKEMAKKLGVSLSSLQKYEYGDFYPSAEVIRKIVDFFKITLNDFLDVNDITNEEKDIINWNIKRSRELEKEFENDIEEEIYDESRDKKNYKNKPFYALETVINSNYIVPKRLEEKVRKIFEEIK